MSNDDHCSQNDDETFQLTTGEHRQEAQPQRQKSMWCLKRARSSSLFSSDSLKLWFTNSFPAECAVQSQTDLNVAATLGLCLLSQMEKQKDLKEGSGKACYITSFPKSPSKKNIVMDKWAVEIIWAMEKCFCIWFLRRLRALPSPVHIVYLSEENVSNSLIILPWIQTSNLGNCCLLARGCSLSWPDSFFQKLDNMATPSLPSKISCSLPAFFQKISLSLEDWLYLKSVSKPEAWFIFSLTLGSDSC